MADEVATGVWWLAGTRGSNVFAIELPGQQLAIVDSGFPGQAEAIVREIRSLPGEVTPSLLLLTHGHPDHAGSAGELRGHFGLEVVLGAADTRERAGRIVLDERLSGRRPPRGPVERLVRQLARRLGGRRGGRFARQQGAPVPVDRVLTGEVEIVPGLLAVPVPGHTPGSYCFLAPGRGVAFVGDLVISHPGALSRPLALSNHDDEQFLRSLSSFATRAPEVGCPGHGEPLVGNFRRELLMLAALPRRSLLSPRLLWGRLRRLAGFRGHLAGRRGGEG